MSKSSDLNEESAKKEEYLALPPAELRAYFDAHLHADADLDAFCLDWYREVYKQFSSGMTRTQKLNLLIHWIVHRQEKRASAVGTSRYRIRSSKKRKRLAWRKLKPMVVGAIFFDWLRRTLNAVWQTVSAVFGKLTLLGVLGGATVGAGIGVLVYVKQPHKGDESRPPDPQTAPHSPAELAATVLHPVLDMHAMDLSVTDFSPPPDGGSQGPALATRRRHLPACPPDLSSAPPAPADMVSATDLIVPMDMTTSTPDAAFSAAFYTNPPPPWLPMVTISAAQVSGATGVDGNHSSSTLRIRHKFLMARYEVTQRQYRKVIKLDSPSHFRDAKEEELPVENISWLAAIQFCNALSLNQQLPVCYHISKTEVKWLGGLDCPGYRLPTEEEWIYAAYAGQTSEYAGGVDPSRVAWYFDNADYRTHPVGRKSANAWQLYDMSGNVGEWMWDRYQPQPSKTIYDAALDTARVIRGGSYFDDIKRISLTRRQGERPQYKSSQIGLRVVRTAR